METEFVTMYRDASKRFSSELCIALVTANNVGIKRSRILQYKEISPFTTDFSPQASYAQ